MMLHEKLLKHAEAVRLAWESEQRRRKTARKLERLETKVADGHDNLVGFRDNVAEELAERERAARAHAERRALLERLASTLPGEEAA